jgi:DNA-binding transcriptional LysR family regulator
MDIASLQTFLAIADTGSFSAAAERVFLTQPAISKRIAALESELGTALFDRIGRRVQLTEAGLALQERARTILAEVEDARRAISRLSGTVRGTLRMAASHHIGLHRLPPALKRFHDSYPGARLDLHFLDSESGCAAVEQGELELAVVTLPARSSPRLQQIPIWKDPIDIVVGLDHPLAKVSPVTPLTLLNYPAILPGPGTFTREIVLSALSNIREGVQIGMSTNYLEVLKMLAAVGLGWSALPRTLIDESLSVVQIKGIAIQRELGVVIHRSRTLSNAGQAMLDMIHQCAQ